MSYETIMACTRDTAFQDRVIAGAEKEAHVGGPEFSGSTFGEQVRRLPQAALNTFIWPLSIDNEADYEYAVNTGHENPGGSDVISDAKIQAGVQHWWPLDPLNEPLNPPSTVVDPPHPEQLPVMPEEPPHVEHHEEPVP